MVDLVVKVTLAFSIQTKTQFLEYYKQVIFQYDTFRREGPVVIFVCHIKYDLIFRFQPQP